MANTDGIIAIRRAAAEDDEEREEKVSRKHAELGLYGPDAWVLRDLASTNGTALNDRRLDDRAALKRWDLIRVGDTRLRFAVIDRAVKVA